MYVCSLSKYLHDFKRPVEHAASELTLESEFISFSNSAKCDKAIHIVFVLLLLGGVGQCCAWHVQVSSGLIGSYLK
jgi:hypothetical protein